MSILVTGASGHLGRLTVQALLDRGVAANTIIATARTPEALADLADGILLCGHHHRLIHHPDYTHQRLPNGDIRYHRRT
jgi:NADP-dependent 3-hydroxy acid dehydrogenase YdfG